MITDQEIRALAFLAAAIRDRLRLAPWHPQGTHAAIAKCADRDLADIAFATIRAARDPKAKTPGVIPTAGPHWIEAHAPEVVERDATPVSELCSVCLQPEARCRRLWSHDHAFRANRKPERPAVDVHATVQGIKDLKAPSPTPKLPQPAQPTPNPEGADQ